MPQIYEVIAKALPVILLIILGIAFRLMRVISDRTAADFKKIIVNFALPSTLFLTFARTAFQREYILIFITVFASCVLMLAAGVGLGKIISPGNKYYPALFTGFEAGMMGYALFTSFFGSENTYKFAVIDVGQVIFVFFVLTAYLQRQNGVRATAKKLLKDFFLSPVILSILLGILAGSTGFYAAVAGNPASQAVVQTLGLVGSLTQPLICIVIGYELRINLKNIRGPFLTVVLRLAAFFAVAWAINIFLIDRTLHLDRSFQLAVYTMFLLPPPFIIPIYMDSSAGPRKAAVLDTISLHILCSLAAFVILVSVM